MKFGKVKLPNNKQRLIGIRLLSKKATNLSEPTTIDNDSVIDGNNINERAFYFVDNSSNSVEITLPSASEIRSKSILIKALHNPSVNTITVKSDDNIDGNATFNFTNALETIEVVSDGSTYQIIY